MKHTIAILFFTPLLLSSCQNKTNGDETIHVDFPEVNDEFTTLLDKFEKKQLPITFKGCKDDISQLKTLSVESGTAYRAYAQIPTNRNFVATIKLGLADCALPILTTYTLSGKVIDEKTIAIGYCGSDCGYNCEEFMTLNADYTFYTSDTVSTYECDSLGNEISGTYEHYVIYKEGKLNSNGTITLSKEIKKSL